MLDKRQRAMLCEMGVRVWQPAAPAPAPELAALAVPLPKPELKKTAVPPAPIQAKNAIDSVASSASPASGKGTFRPQISPMPPPVLSPASEHHNSNVVSWSAGPALALYTELHRAAGPRWLVLAETPAAAIPDHTMSPDALFNPFDGQSGKLLDNMLRAVNLHKNGSVLLAPLVRRMSHGAALTSDFHAALASLVQTVQPDVVLVMGRLAVQAVLQSSEPFGKLRGQVHTLHGSPAIATHDAAYLLRSPPEKAKAWEDLCLALSVVPGTL